MVYLLSLLLSISASAKTLHVRLPGAPLSLDWTGQVSMPEAPLVVNLCEGLFRIEYPSEKLTPAIASTVKKSKDLKQYTFHINENAKWSDGRAIYAKDFVDGWQRLLSPQSTSIYSYYLFDLVNAREYNSKKITSFDDVGVHAINDHTLVVKFKHPQKNWEVTTSFWPLFPVRKDLIERFGNNWWRAGTLVSSGPFVYSSFEPGKSILFKRNPFYKKTTSNIDEIKFELIADEDDAIKKYQEKVFPFITGVGTKKFLKSGEFHPIPLLCLYVIAINCERFPFNNLLFRKAVLSAFNREKIIPAEYTQLVTADEIVPPSILSNKEDLTVPYDPKKAKEYLLKSGVVLGGKFKLNFLTKISEPFYEISKNIASQIESSLGIGVDTLAYKTREFETFSRLGEYNLLMVSWTAKVRNPQDFLYPYSSAYSSSNRSHFSSEDYDHAIEEGEFKKAELIIAKESAAIHPLFFEKAGYLSHPNIKNIYFDFQGNPILKNVVLK